jgi:hypothetical protein
MEHATGQNFYHVHGDPRLAGAGLVEVALRLCEGLVALHGAGAIHGAVSPGNIVWTEAGVRLVDLAVRVPEESASDEAGPASDVRALAAVVLEMAAGREEDPPPWIDEVAAIARGQASPSAAQWAASLRAGAAPPPAPVVQPPPVQVPVVQVPSFLPVETGPEEHGLESLFQETGPSEPLAGVVEAPAEAVPEREPARAMPPPAEPLAREAAAAEPPTLEPVRPASVEDEAWASAPRKRKRRRTGLIVGAIAVVLVLIVWKLASGSAAPPEPAPVPVEAPQRRSELAVEATTLARSATPPEAEAVPAAPPVEPLAESEPPPKEVAATAESTPADQLSAADFRRIMLRASRTQRARECYERHAAGDVEVDLVALVGAHGKVQKLKIAGDALGECLRKIVLRLEFPRAARPAQHNFVFHRPDAG